MCAKGRGFALLAVALGLASPATASFATTIYEFSYVSTRDPNYNNAAHLLNTGIQLRAGDLVHLSGTGRIHVGGPYYVWSNFDMGLISPINNVELMRSYHGIVSNYVAAPIPLAGESVLFAQDRTSLTDDHDLSIWTVAQTSGRLYIGMFDHFYADNTGQHAFRITVVPEPSSAAMVLFFSILLLCRRRSWRGLGVHTPSRSTDRIS